MKGYSLDPHPDANVADRHFAVIYSPRRKRDRFPSTTVTLFSSKEEAVAWQDHEKKNVCRRSHWPGKIIRRIQNLLSGGMARVIIYCSAALLNLSIN